MLEIHVPRNPQSNGICYMIDFNVKMLVDPEIGQRDQNWNSNLSFNKYSAITFILANSCWCFILFITFYVADGHKTFLTNSQLRWHGTTHSQTDSFCPEEFRSKCGRCPGPSGSSKNLPLKRAVTSVWQIC